MSELYDAAEMVDDLQDRGLSFSKAVRQASSRFDIEAEDLCEYIGAQTRAGLLRKHKKYLQSPEWSRRREMYLAIHPRCAACNTTWRLQVHHLSYSNIPNERDEDLQTLCKSCHEEEHGRKFEPESDQDRMKRAFNPPGNVAIAAEIRRLTALHRQRHQT